MTKFVELVEQKDAAGFQTAIEEAMAGRVSLVLDGLKETVARSFLGSIGEAMEPGPGVGQAPDPKGGLSQAAGTDNCAGGDHSDEKGGFKAGNLKKIHYRPAIGKAQDLPAKTNEEHVGFKAVEASAKKSGAKNPAAVAAAVGFKKYGKKRMEKAAHSGKPANKVH